MIEGLKCKLIPFTGEYITSKYIAWLNDPEVVKFSKQRHTKHDRESCLVYWNTFDGIKNIGWAIISDSVHIGNITAHIDEKGSVELALLIGEKSVWGKGYGTDAWRSVCNYFLKQDRIKRIKAGTVLSNTGMRKIMMRCGMTEEWKIQTKDESLFLAGITK